MNKFLHIGLIALISFLILGCTQPTNDNSYKIPTIVGHFYNLAMSNDGTKLIAFIEPYSSSEMGSIHSSSDSGTSWSIVKATTSFDITWLRQVASSSDCTRLVATVATGGLWISSNSGVSWTMANNTYSEWYGATCSSDGKNIIVCGDGTYAKDFLISTNYGSTWTAKTCSDSLTGMTASQDCSKVFGCGWIAGGSGYYLRSLDSGSTWASTYFSHDAYVIASSSDGTKVFSGDAPGDLFRSIDSGATWQNLTTGTSLNGKSWTSIACSSDGTKVFAVGSANGAVYIFYSGDSGTTWSNLSQGTSIDCSLVGSVHCSIDGSRVAYRTNSAIYYSSDLGVSWKTIVKSGI